MKVKKISIYTDVSYCDFSKVCFGGYLIYHGQDLIKKEVFKEIRLANSFEGEIWILSKVLEKNFFSLKANGIKKIFIFSDAKTQVQEYKVNSKIKKMFDKFNFTFIKNFYYKNGIHVRLKYIQGHRKDNPNAFVHELCSASLKKFRKENNIIIAIPVTKRLKVYKGGTI